MNTERNSSLIGKSGTEYYGKIYEDKNSETSLGGKVIVCLSNSSWTENHWLHLVRDIYHDDAVHALNHFRDRDDISHLILIPESSSNVDVIDDLRRRYLHE